MLLTPWSALVSIPLMAVKPCDNWFAQQPAECQVLSAASKQSIRGLQVPSEMLEGITKIVLLYSDCKCSDQHYKHLFEGSSSYAFNKLPVEIHRPLYVLKLWRSNTRFLLWRRCNIKSQNSFFFPFVKEENMQVRYWADFSVHLHTLEKSAFN